MNRNSKQPQTGTAARDSSTRCGAVFGSSQWRWFSPGLRTHLPRTGATLAASTTRPTLAASATTGPRSGFTFTELIGTMVLLGALMSMTIPLLHRVNAQRRAADTRQFAVQETANIMERFSARDWGDITPASAKAVPISADAKAALREPSLAITVQPTSTQPPAKRIRIELRWKNREGDFVAPVRLTSYVYRIEEPK